MHAVENAPPRVQVASFRDPSGRLFRAEDRIIRVLADAKAQAEVLAFLELPKTKAAIESGKLVKTRVLDATAAAPLLEVAQRSGVVLNDAPLVLEHERVEFQSFPYEWPPEMLAEAGRLTLELARGFLDQGFGLKDATPYNVLFQGPKPVFVDIPSFEQRAPADPTWLPYAQFIRTFLMPLLVNQRFGLSLAEVLSSHRDGMEPEEVYRLVGPFARLLPPYLSLITLPTWLGKRGNADDGKLYEPKRLDNAEKARFILDSLLAGLERSLSRFTPTAARDSTWSGYMAEGGNNYTAEHQQAKQAFVSEALAKRTPKRALDVGCNTGTFSAIAARAGARVVAIDYDPVVAGEVWRMAQKDKLDILPLVCNLARPTPSLGWMNRECPSFLERARGKFDAVLMLAVIHHMLVTERVPLPDILSLAAELTTDLLVIEFIAPDDSMFKRLTRGRDHLFASLNHQVFEAEAARHFEIERVQHVEGTSRWLYALRRRSK